MGETPGNLGGEQLVSQVQSRVAVFGEVCDYFQSRGEVSLILSETTLPIEPSSDEVCFDLVA